MRYIHPSLKEIWRNLGLLGPPCSLLFHFFLLFPHSITLAHLIPNPQFHHEAFCLFSLSLMTMITWIKDFLCARHCSIIKAHMHDLTEGLSHDGLHELHVITITTKKVGGTSHKRSVDCPTAYSSRGQSDMQPTKQPLNSGQSEVQNPCSTSLYSAPPQQKQPP